LKVVVLGAAVIYAAIAGVIYLAQDSLVFHPQPAAAPPGVPAGWRVEDVSFTTSDATRLAGILLLPPVERVPLIVYFGGNAEEATGHGAQAAALYGQRAVLLVNYRGYGASGGKPSETALVSDAAEIYDWAAQRREIDAGRIALHGRSLGTGVAVQLAAARPARCVVLTSPFASALGVAREAYPWLPVAALLRHRFDSESHAPDVKAPLLVVAGGADTVIRPRHSQRLASRWGGSVERVTLEGFGHDDLDMSPRYAQSVRAFLDRCLA
jgi:uncharacterized protein